mgnify:FL=1
MGVDNTNNRMDYTGNGTTDTYAYNFKIFEDSELRVVVEKVSDGTLTTLTLTTDYVVEGAGEGSGGSITFVDNGQVYLDSDGFLDTGYTLTIRRVLPLTQETDIRNQGPYYPSIHEDQFDRFIMIDQQQQDEIDRSIKAPETEDTGPTIPTVAERANSYAYFNEDGDIIGSNGGIDGSLPVSSFIEGLLDDANAAAARTTLGAQQATTDMAELLSPATDDFVPIRDTSGVVDNKISLTNLMTVLAKDTAFPAGEKVSGVFSNLGFAAATGAVAADTIRIQGAGAALSATNPFLINMPSTATPGLVVTLSATADVTILLTGAHWGLGTNGDFSGIALRVYAINDNGTLKFGVSNRGGYRSISSGSCTTTRTSVTNQFNMLVNSSVTAGTWPCVEIGHFLASFDDTGGSSEDLWTIATTLNSLNPGLQPQVITDWQSIAMTTGFTGGSHTVTAYEKFVGDTWFVRGRVQFTSIFTGGSATIIFPSGRRIDTSKIHPLVTNFTRLGDSTLIDTTNNTYVGCVLHSSTSQVQIQAVTDDQGNGAAFLTHTGFSTANPFTWTNDDLLDRKSVV